LNALNGKTLSAAVWFYNNKYVTIINSEYILLRHSNTRKKTYRLKYCLSNNNNNITIIIDLNNIKNRFHLFSSINTWRSFSRAYRGAAGKVMIRMGNGKQMKTIFYIV
jgi:hypothetical protein